MSLSTLSTTRPDPRDTVVEAARALLAYEIHGGPAFPDWDHYFDALRRTIQALPAAAPLSIPVLAAPRPDLADVAAKVESALRWLAEPSPQCGEYECGHGVPVISGECAEAGCAGHIVREALVAIRALTTRSSALAGFVPALPPADEQAGVGYEQSREPARSPSDAEAQTDAIASARAAMAAIQERDEARSSRDVAYEECRRSQERIARLVEEYGRLESSLAAETARALKAEAERDDLAGRLATEMKERERCRDGRAAERARAEAAEKELEAVGAMLDRYQSESEACARAGVTPDEALARAERAEAAIMARHEGEPLALLAALDEARARGALLASHPAPSPSVSRDAETKAIDAARRLDAACRKHEEHGDNFPAYWIREEIDALRAALDAPSPRSEAESGAPNATKGAGRG